MTKDEYLWGIPAPSPMHEMIVTGHFTTFIQHRAMFIDDQCVPMLNQFQGWMIDEPICQLAWDDNKE